MRGVLGLVPVGLGHGLLELDGRAERVHGAGELDQRTVARQLDQPAAVAGQCRLQALGAMGLQPGQRAVLVAAHQARVANDIRRQDRRQSPYNPLAGQGASPRLQPAALRRCSRLVCILGTGAAVSSLLSALKIDGSVLGSDGAVRPNR